VAARVRRRIAPFRPRACREGRRSRGSAASRGAGGFLPPHPRGPARRDARTAGSPRASAADEQVTLFAPAEGTYDIYVNGYATPRGGAGCSLTNFVVGPASAGNATITPDPASVTIAGDLTLTVTWSGLDAAKRWLGVISYERRWSDPAFDSIASGEKRLSFRGTCVIARSSNISSDRPAGRTAAWQAQPSWSMRYVLRRWR